MYWWLFLFLCVLSLGAPVTAAATGSCERVLHASLRGQRSLLQFVKENRWAARLPSLPVGAQVKIGLADQSGYVFGNLVDIDKSNIGISYLEAGSGKLARADGSHVTFEILFQGSDLPLWKSDWAHFGTKEVIEGPLIYFHQIDGLIFFADRIARRGEGYSVRMADGTEHLFDDHALFGQMSAKVLTPATLLTAADRAKLIATLPTPVGRVSPFAPQLKILVQAMQRGEFLWESQEYFDYLSLDASLTEDVVLRALNSPLTDKRFSSEVNWVKSELGWPYLSLLLHPRLLSEFKRFQRFVAHEPERARAWSPQELFQAFSDHMGSTDVVIVEALTTGELQKIREEGLRPQGYPWGEESDLFDERLWHRIFSPTWNANESQNQDNLFSTFRHFFGAKMMNGLLRSVQFDANVSEALRAAQQRKPLGPRRLYKLSARIPLMRTFSFQELVDFKSQPSFALNVFGKARVFRVFDGQVNSALLGSIPASELTIQPFQSSAEIVPLIRLK